MPRRAARTLLQTAILILLCGCSEEILHELSEREANKLSATLDSAGIPAKKERESSASGWALSVSRSDAARALRVLHQRRMLPAVDAPVVEKSSLLIGREEAHFRLQRAVAREMEITLGSIEGVLEARVHLSLQPSGFISALQTQAANKHSASVLLLVSGEFAVKESDLASLVAGAAALPAANVKVLVYKASAEGTGIAAPKVGLTSAHRQQEEGISGALAPLWVFVAAHSKVFTLVAAVLALLAAVLLVIFMRGLSLVRASNAAESA